jgi:glycosyltransferase involved in cell wall biosynthesis
MAGLQARGHTLRVVSTNTVGLLGPLLATYGIPAEGVPFRGRAGWRSHLQLRAAVRRNPADALMMTGPSLTGMLCLSARHRDRQILAVHYHHSGVKHPWSWKSLYTLALTRFSKIVFPSNFIRLEAEALYPALRRISQTVRNPLAIPDLPDSNARRTARDALGLPLNVPVIGNAGWLIPRKRFDVFLRAAARVRSAVPDSIFVIAGDGPERARLMALSEELGVAPAVHWLGWRPDLMSFYRALDVLLFNADWDAFPTTPLEAMGYAIPVVASALNSGLCEAITDPRYGVLLGTHDEPALADAVVALLRDPAAARRLGLTGRARVAELCEPETTVAAYERLLTGGPRSA